jgi:hypothetical protein
LLFQYSLLPPFPPFLPLYVVLSIPAISNADDAFASDRSDRAHHKGVARIKNRLGTNVERPRIVDVEVHIGGVVQNINVPEIQSLNSDSFFSL